ncbi:MAG: nitrous oxide reductase family maturation protein NosD [Flavobacterium sp.]
MKFLLSLLFFISAVTLQAQVVNVGKKFPIKTIKQGLAVAKSGDTVKVHSGIYKEGNILIDKKIVFIGIDHPTIDGEKKYEVISIKHDSVVVDGFKIIRSSSASLSEPSAIKVYAKKHILIQNNILNDNFFGIYLENCAFVIVKNNVIKAYEVEEQKIGNGVHCWKSSNIQVIGNTIIGHRDGVYFEFVSESIVWRNISDHNKRYGLHFMFSNSNSYITNIFRNNGAGVAVMYSKRVKMFNNIFEKNRGNGTYGLLLKDISDSYMFNNKFIDNTIAIYSEGSIRIKIEKNEFLNNGWAFKIQANSMDNEIVNNNFKGNTFDMATNGTLVMNTFDSNYWDKYEGYDLNKDGIGDVPYHPLSLFAVLVESTPSTMLLYRSFMITLLDKSEKVLPSITPDNFIDNSPLMKSLPL